MANNDETHYYRFIEPKPGFPEQIELFSRRADFKLDQRIIPVFISEDVSSLSAIVLFQGIKNQKKQIIVP